MNKSEDYKKGGSVSMMLVVALFYIFVGGVMSQLGEVPPCDLDRAQLCFNNAIQSQIPSGCNWYRIIPSLYTCVDASVAGCSYDSQIAWYSNVDSFNASLQSDDCYPGCTNQATRESKMYSCFDAASFSSLAPSIAGDPSQGPSSPACTTLITMNNCLTDATSGCPALTDVTYARINSTSGGNAAYARCSIGLYQPATTSAPLDVLNTLPDPTYPPTTTSSSTSINGVKGTDLLIIILGAALVLATILIIIVAICLARRRNAIKKRTLLRDWRPNGQEMYRDEPNQFIRRETIDFRSANEGGRVFRPHHVSEEREERNVREVYVNRGAVIQH